ncbi:MAG: arsenate reductase (azurin) small subunit [Chlorobiaceae bacterium]|nr:arsenate reductase (azurin) small subunit [Chlorobiaceae bacterium]
MSISRRKFLQSSTAGMALALFGLSGKAESASGKKYPSLRIGNIRELKAGEPVQFNYPDSTSPCTLVMLNETAIGGVGTLRNVVAFSSLCPHMGCPVNYKSGRFVCGCHYSMFDAAKNGQTYQGLASQWLAQVTLRFDKASGNIYAEGVEGLLYGRISNLNIS